jgi:hypothetical protein
MIGATLPRLLDRMTKHTTPAVLDGDRPARSAWIGAPVRVELTEEAG